MRIFRIINSSKPLCAWQILHLWLCSTMSRTPNEREEVVRIIQRSKTPISPRDIQKRSKGRIHTSTIYRALKALVELGVVRRVDLGTRSARFEYVDAAHHHHHLVCIKCGTVEDVSVCLPRKTLASVLSRTDFAKLVEHRLEFSGVCKSCE